LAILFAGARPALQAIRGPRIFGFRMHRILRAFVGLSLVSGGVEVLPLRPARALETAVEEPSTTAASPKPAGPRAVERIEVLEPTTDGVELAAWHYAAPEASPPLATVILIHDLGGSHLTVEPLAEGLQAGGCTVVAADLRGHGESKLPRSTGGADDPTKLLRQDEIAMIAASTAGRMRDQAGVRGDIECVRAWIKRETDSGRIPSAPLFVVGSGLGALLASAWTVADASWPDIASGPQGREVVGLVLISPPFVVKGLRMTPFLTSDSVGQSVPVMVVAGKGDRDAFRVFDQLKRQRRESWYDSRFPPGGDRGSSPVPAANASAILFSVPTDRRGDGLAAARAARGDTASLILAFMRIRLGDKP